MARRGDWAPERAAPEPPRETLRVRLRRAAPMGLLATAATFVATLLGLEGVLASALDPFAPLRRARTDDRLVVVRIEDTDYHDFFGGKSPLDPTRVEMLLHAVAAGGPAVIGVDLDTSDPAFRALRQPDGVPVVWAREAAECGAPHTPAGCTPGELVLGDVLGGRNPQSWMGIASLQADPDGVIRRYRRELPGGSTARPTLPTLLAEFADTSARRPRDQRERMIVYRPVEARFSFPASEIVDLAKEPGFRESLKGKAVLLGGAYPEARDHHPTPLGPMPGVDVWAQVVETELEGGGYPAPAPLAVATLAFLHGLMVLVLFARMRFERAAVWSVAASLALAPVSSLLVTWGGTGALWPYFIPVWGTVLAQQLFDSAKEYRDAWFAALYRDGLAANAREIPAPRESSSEPPAPAASTVLG